MKKGIIVMAVALLVLAGCSNKNDPMKAGNANAPSNAVANAVEAPKSSKYIVKIGSTVITEDDIKREYDTLPPQMRALLFDQNGRFNADELIGSIIKKEVLYQEAKKRGLDNSPDYKANLDRGNKQNEEINRQIEALKRRVEETSKLALIQTIFDQEVVKKAEGVKVSDAEIKGYYTKNKPEFTKKSKDGKPVVMDFEQAKPLIKRRLTLQKQNDVFEGYIESIKKDYKVDINKTEAGSLSNSPSFRMQE